MTNTGIITSITPRETAPGKVSDIYTTLALNIDPDFQIHKTASNDFDNNSKDDDDDDNDNGDNDNGDNDKKKDVYNNGQNIPGQAAAPPPPNSNFPLPVVDIIENEGGWKDEFEDRNKMKRRMRQSSGEAGRPRSKKKVGSPRK